MSQGNYEASEQAFFAARNRLDEIRRNLAILDGQIPLARSAWGQLIRREASPADIERQKSHVAELIRTQSALKLEGKKAERDVDHAEIALRYAASVTLIAAQAKASDELEAARASWVEAMTPLLPRAGRLREALRLDLHRRTGNGHLVLTDDELLSFVNRGPTVI